MGNWETDWGRDALERIVILLFSLASLADLAADAPFLRRRRVLGILSYGEAEARAFVLEISTGVPVSADTLEQTGDTARLTVRLRALALMLCVLLTQRFALSGAAGSRACRRSHRISGPLPRSVSSAPNTS